MIDIHFLFYDFLRDLAGSRYLEENEVIADLQLSSLSPTVNKPWRNIYWLFSHYDTKPVKGRRSKHPFHEGGQKLFLDFFLNLHLVLYKGMEQPRSIEIQHFETHVIEFFDYSDTGDAHLVKKKFKFSELLESLLITEFEKFKVQLNYNISQKDDYDNLRSSLIYHYSNFEKLTRVTHPAIPEYYQNVFESQFFTIKNRIEQYIIEKIPHDITDVAEKLSTKGRQLNKIVRAFDKLEIRGQRVFHEDWTSITNLKNLIVNKDPGQRVNFNCSSAALTLIFENLINKGENVNKYCNGLCLFYMHKDKFTPISAPSSFYAGKNRIKEDEKTQIENFFKLL